MRVLKDQPKMDYISWIYENIREELLTIRYLKGAILIAENDECLKQIFVDKETISGKPMAYTFNETDFVEII